MSASARAAAASALVSSLPAALAASVWRADQMASSGVATTPTGHALLDQQLPYQGWPHGGLIELLLQQTGIGEMRLLQPALSRIATRRIALLQPPHLPHIASWSGWGLPAEQLLWIRTSRQADALWSAEQILRNGSCGALLLWQSSLRSDALRRLQLAAQHTGMLCWLMRPLSVAQDASPAPLRLALRPLAGGVQVDVIKRRGPQCSRSLQLQWAQSAPLLSPSGSSRVPQTVLPAGVSSHASVDSRAPAALSVAGAAPALV